MKRKKSKFLTFLCSLIPGAGHMYLGFMKMGVSLLLTFVGIICIATWTGIDQLVSVGFVVWIYSFFHIHNIAGAPDEEFQKLEDRYLIAFSSDVPKNMQRVVAISLILLGSLMFIHVLPHMLPQFILNYMPNGIFYYLPQSIIALVLIAVGIIMIIGKKVSLEYNTEQMQSDGMPVNNGQNSMQQGNNPASRQEDSVSGSYPASRQERPVQTVALVEKEVEQTVIELPAPDEHQQ